VIEQRAQRRRGEGGDAPLGEVRGQLLDRPPRQCDALMIGAGARDRDDAIALLGRRLGWAPAPIVRVQGRKPSVVEVMDHLAHVRGVGQIQPRNIGRRHLRCRRQQDHRPHARAAMLGARREPLQALGLLRRQRPDEHFRGTHHHLHDRDTSPFAAATTFPVKRSGVSH